jgi:FkbM family methyltransferase
VGDLALDMLALMRGSESSAARQRLKAAAHSVAQRIGFDVIRSESAIPALTTPAILRETGTTVVVDVGANSGQYGSKLRREGYRGRIVSFEPMASAFALLEEKADADPAWTCVRVAVGAAPGEATLHVTANSASSSLLSMGDETIGAEPATAVVADETVKVEPLDELVHDLLIGDDRVFLKVDVQGYEREVLEGAEETIRRAQAMQVELALVQLYEGQALIHELLGYLYDRGFDLVDLSPGFKDRRTGQLLETDALFRRRRPG